MIRRLTALAVASVLSVHAFGTANSAHGQVPRDSGGVYALINGRIVSEPGRVLERGTIVVRDGRIVEVGQGVEVPKDAERLDLDGLVVYPGLIDAATTVGMPPTYTLGGAGDETGHLRPRRNALDVAELSEERRAAFRAAGVTTVGLAYHGGTDSTGVGPQHVIMQRDQPGVPGQTAVVNVGSGALATQTLRSPAALQMGLGTRKTLIYPTTLMGAIAFLHQTFIDAKYRIHHLAAFEKNPASVPAPPYRPELDALAPAATGRQTVWLSVSQENNIDRALDLASELDLDVRLLGVQEGYRTTDRLASHGAPVLVSLDYTLRLHGSGHSFEQHRYAIDGRTDARARADESVVRELKGNAATLQRAGIPIALTSYGLAQPLEFLARVREAVRAGLPADEALRALTLTPAAVLGVETQVGSIAPGKLANLLVTDGDLFSSGTEIRHVFVAGHRFDTGSEVDPMRTAAGGGS